MPGKQAEAVVAGHICLDLIPSFAGGETRLEGLLAPGKLVNVGPLTSATGGAVSNTGLALHRLGVRAKLMGKVGDDLVGRAILDIIRAHGPELAEGMIVEQGLASSYTVVISPPGVDRVFLHCPGANDAFGADDVSRDELAGARVLHFGYPPLMRRMYADGGGELASLLRRAREQGLAASLDMARPDPASEAGRADWRGILARALPHVDIFLPGFDETLFMLDRARFDRMEREARPGDINARADPALLAGLAEQLLEMGAAIVGLKLGAQGLYLRTTADQERLAGLGRCAPAEPRAWAGRELFSPCFEARVVGATGSGDSAIAGFLAGLLRGLRVEQVMTAAAAVGACNVEQADATSGIPTWEVVERRIAAGWRRRPAALPLPGWQWEEGEGIWRGPGDH